MRPLSQKQVVGLGIGIGAMVFRFSRKRKKTALTNLNIIFSDSQTSSQKIKRIKDSFKLLAVSAMQSIWVTINTEERVRQLIPKEPEGLDILKKCLEKNKGVLFLTAHYGNWEVMGSVSYTHLRAHET